MAQYPGSSPFYVAPADYAPALGGMTNFLQQQQQQRMAQEQMAAQQAEREQLMRMRDLDLEGKAQGMAQERQFASARGEALGFAPLEISTNPEVARHERQILQQMGIDSPEKMAEVVEFAEEFSNTPTEQLPNVINERVQKVVERGGNAEDSLSLKGMPPEQAQAAVDYTKMVINNEAVRRMYAIDPEATKRFLGGGGDPVKILKGQGSFVKDESGNVAYAQSITDPTTGQTRLEIAELPTGYKIVNSAGLTPDEDKAYKTATKEAVTTAELNARMEKEPELKSAIEKMVQSEKVQAAVEKEKRLETETTGGQLDIAKKQLENIQAQAAQETAKYTAQDSIDLLNRLQTSDLDLIYGRGESYYPELLRSQEGIDMIADRDRLVSLLKMGSRKELKGQGPISDFETKILAEAATTLSNPNISPEAAQRELQRILPLMQRVIGPGAQPAQQQNARSRLEALKREVGQP